MHSEKIFYALIVEMNIRLESLNLYHGYASWGQSESRIKFFFSFQPILM
jgi:hypothetical protein